MFTKELSNFSDDLSVHQVYYYVICSVYISSYSKKIYHTFSLTSLETKINFLNQFDIKLYISYENKLWYLISNEIYPFICSFQFEERFDQYPEFIEPWRFPLLDNSLEQYLKYRCI